MKPHLPYLVALSLALAAPAAAQTNGGLSAETAAARAASHEGRWTAALTLWKTLSDAHPDDAAVAAEYGWAQMQNGQTADARRTFNRVLRLDPANVRAEEGRVTMAIRALDPQEALRIARAAVKASPKSAAAYRILGDAQRASSNRAEAETAYRRAVALDPDSAANHAGLGETLLSRNNATEALREFRAATRLEPANGAYQDGLARAAMAAGAYGESALADANAMSLALKPTPDWTRLDTLALNALDALGRASTALRTGSESRETFSQANTKILEISDAVAALPVIEKADVTTDPAMAQRAMAYDLMGQAAASDLVALRNGTVSEASDAFVFREQARRAFVTARAAAGPS